MAGFCLFVYEGDQEIVGESAQKTADEGAPRHKYEGWIELNSVNETITRSIEAGRSGAARQRSGSILEDITIEKEMDNTTSDVLKACAGGRAFEWVYIDLCTSTAGTGESQSLIAYLEMSLNKVRVTEYSFDASGVDDGAIPRETIKLNFDRIEWKYFPFGGSYPNVDSDVTERLAPIVTGWDIVSSGPWNA